jgi:RNA polymerase sigma-70 factor, ECF subfamily
LRGTETKAAAVGALNLETARNIESSSGETASEMTDLEALYREQASFVWRNARRLGCDASLAEDVVHEVFLVVARRLSEFRHEASIRTWLFAITYRSVQRILRNHARYQRRLREYATGRQLEPSIQPGGQNEAGQYLRHLLSQLDECKRVVFILAELEGMTSLEIAQVLGLKSPTVDSRLRAARIKLSRLYERDRTQDRIQLRRHRP